MESRAAGGRGARRSLWFYGCGGALGMSVSTLASKPAESKTHSLHAQGRTHGGVSWDVPLVMLPDKPHF